MGGGSAYPTPPPLPGGDALKPFEDGARSQRGQHAPGDRRRELWSPGKGAVESVETGRSPGHVKFGAAMSEEANKAESGTHPAVAAPRWPGLWSPEQEGVRRSEGTETGAHRAHHGGHQGHGGVGTAATEGLGQHWKRKKLSTDTSIHS